MNKKRPVHLNVLQISLPLPALVSILHRVSGVILFLALHLLLLLLQYSLHSPESYAQLAQTLQHPLIKIVWLGLLWGFVQHFCSGIRHLALDMHHGVKLAQARASSRWVMIISLVITLLLGAWLW